MDPLVYRNRVAGFHAFAPESYANGPSASSAPPVRDPNADADHDGMSNYQEYIAGTDPLSDQSGFKLVSIRPAQPSGIVIQWSSVSNKTYSVLRSASAAPTTRHRFEHHGHHHHHYVW